MLFWYGSLRLSIQGRTLHIPSYSQAICLHLRPSPMLMLIAPYGPQCLPLHSLSRISLCYTFKLSIEGLKLSWAIVFTVSDLWQSLKTEFHYLNCKSDTVPIVSVPFFPVLLHFLLLIAKCETLSKQFCKFKSLFQIKSTVDRNFPNSKRIVAGSPSSKGGKL